MTALSRYRRIPTPIKLLIAAQFLVNMLLVAGMLIFNLYLRDLGYDDATIARVQSYRFIGTLTLALPVGMLLRGRRLKPLFLLALTLFPVSTWVAVGAAAAGDATLLALAMTTSGISHMCMQVSSLPFIMRSGDVDTRTEAIALSFSTFSLSLVACGVLIPLLKSLGTVAIAGLSWTFDDAGILRGLALVGLAGLPVALAVREGEPRNAPLQLRTALQSYDWKPIGRAALPSVAIAVGAGLTIPYVNLFFNSVFGLESQQFSALGGVTGVLVFAGALLNPFVKRNFGYSAAITVSQSLAVVFLVLMSMTELLRHLPGMLWVAMACYALRQPLMNMAGPITSELAMSYVGPRNRELMSALQSTIWSGSWFLSAKIFQLLRGSALPYWQIFLITAALYSVGIVLYQLLIRDHERQTAATTSAAH